MEIEPMDTVMLDQRKFKQIVFNLVSNAIKFTPTGGDVMVTAGKATQLPDSVAVAAGFSKFGHDNRAYIELSVIDTGIGMQPDALDKLFQPFVQLDGGLTRKYEGSGLGLAIVKQLVELHNGVMEVKSEVGCGSKFTVYLPYVSVAESATSPLKAAG